MTKKNKKASWVEGVAFVFEECARIDALIVFRRGVWTPIGAGGHRTHINGIGALDFYMT